MELQSKNIIIYDLLKSIKNDCDFSIFILFNCSKNFGLLAKIDKNTFEVKDILNNLVSNAKLI
jgi:hypothetical protein